MGEQQSTKLLFSTTLRSLLCSHHPKTTLLGWCVSTWPPLTLRKMKGIIRTGSCLVLVVLLTGIGISASAQKAIGVSAGTVITGILTGLVLTIRR